MKENKREIDLKKAFAAPPESYVRRTKATLDSLEEADDVKKVAWGTVLAIACALVLMTTAFAAGLNNLRSRDNIAGQQLSQGGTPAASTAGARAVDTDVEISIDDAQFDGEYLYLYFEVRGNEAYQKRALAVDNGYELSVSVNGEYAAPVISNVVAAGAGATRCAGVYKCSAAQIAYVRVDVGNDAIGATAAQSVSADARIQRCRVYQTADSDVPEPAESFALMGDNFEMVQLKYEPDAWPGDFSLKMDADNSALSQYTDEYGRRTLTVLLRGENNPTVKLYVYSDNSGAAPQTITLDISPMAAAVDESYAITYQSECQFDGEILHLRVESNESADMSVTVNGQTPEMLGGVGTIQHAGSDEDISYIYDNVYRCAQADSADVRVTRDAETGAGFNMRVDADDKIKRCALEWRGAGAPDGFSGYAINGPGFGMAVLDWAADGESQPGAGMDYSLNVGGVQANISDYYVNGDAHNRMIVYLSGANLPAEFTLAGNEAHEDIALALGEAYAAQAEQTPPAADKALLSVEKAYRADGCVYVLASIAPSQGKTARWSGEIDRITDEISGLSNNLDESERSQRLYELTREYGAAVNALIQQSQVEAQAIGGADGPTAIYINDGESETADAAPEAAASVGIIGGADGPTSIYANEGEAETADAAPEAAANVGIIGGADGPTSIYVNGGEAETAPNVGVIGGADGPTNIYIGNLDGINLVRKPQLFVNGNSATLCVEDVSAIAKRRDGALKLALVCEAGESDGVYLSVNVDNGELSAQVRAEKWAGGEFEDWMNAVNPYLVNDEMARN